MCYGNNGIKGSARWWNLGIGILYHIIMFGSILPAKFTGVISMPILSVLMLVDAVLLFCLWILLQRLVYGSNK